MTAHNRYWILTRTAFATIIVAVLLLGFALPQEAARYRVECRQPVKGELATSHPMVVIFDSGIVEDARWRGSQIRILHLGSELIYTPAGNSACVIRPAREATQ